tara:strand:- start:227 stop:742 length:516 start_codon:yes stop_codon:yes gene_type:complete
MNWIYNLVKKSKEDNLCIRTGCTTCGSSEFRSLLMTRSAKEAGIYNEKLNSLKLADLDKEQKKICITEICNSLAQPSNGIPSYAIRFILYEIYLNDYISIAEKILKDASVGIILTSMQEHSRKLRAKREERALYESKEATAQRRKLKKDKKAKAHQERVQKYKKRGKMNNK